MWVSLPVVEMDFEIPQQQFNDNDLYSPFRRYHRVWPFHIYFFATFVGRKSNHSIRAYYHTKSIHFNYFLMQNFALLWCLGAQTMPMVIDTLNEELIQFKQPIWPRIYRTTTSIWTSIFKQYFVRLSKSAPLRKHEQSNVLTVFHRFADWLM